MTKAELEERVEKLEKEVRDLREMELQRIAEDEWRGVWMYEVMRMLRRRSIEECTDRFFGYERLSGKELEKVVADASFKDIAKNECRERTFYKWNETDSVIYGYIDEGNSGNTYSATVFAAPPGKKQFKCVLCFNNFKNLITARLALSILMIMMDCNDCSITRMHSPSLIESIKSEQSHEFILGTYRTIDDRYHFAVTADSNSDGTASYFTYYFKKKRTHFDEVGRDYDFSDMVRALACLTSSAKEASGELIIENDYEYMFGDLFDRFG